PPWRIAYFRSVCRKGYSWLSRFSKMITFLRGGAMSYRLAITIAGAVSLGSFEGGVLFEVLDALAQHNEASEEKDRIYIDVLTGASAGGMTAAISAQNLLYRGSALSNPYENPFYNAWVAEVDINGLLPLGEDEPSNESVLSSNFIGKLAQQFLLDRYNAS